MPKAAGVADVSHNACHLLGQGCGLHCTQHLPTLAATPACVGQCCDLRRPQHLSFMSAKTSIYVG